MLFLMQSLRLALALAVCAPFLAAEAQIFRIPQDGSPMPNYWSGTNCRASASVDMFTSEGTPIEPIVQAELLLNGEQVYWWFAANPFAAPWSKAVKVMFDSSHFANNVPVEVTYRVWGLYTGTMYEHESAVDPIVKNKVMMFEHDDTGFTPDAVPIVESRMSGKNYSLFSQYGGTWSDTFYFATMNGSNAVFYAGHGNENFHTATDFTSMWWHEYETERGVHIGSGIPPFNTGAPPVNFCHIVACNCGDTNNFIRACHPYYMAWGGPWMEDQALMAYTVYIRTGDVSIHADKIWSNLAQGWTAGYTQGWFDTIWLDENPGVLRVWDVYPGTPRDMAPGDLALYCGPDAGAMRLKTVYTGNNELPDSPTTPWFWVFTEIVEG
jgi:hypothetical protein